MAESSHGLQESSPQHLPPPRRNRTDVEQGILTQDEISALELEDLQRLQAAGEQQALLAPVAGPSDVPHPRHHLLPPVEQGLSTQRENSASEYQGTQHRSSDEPQAHPTPMPEPSDNAPEGNPLDPQPPRTEPSGEASDGGDSASVPAPRKYIHRIEISILDLNPDGKKEARKYFYSPGTHHFIHSLVKKRPLHRSRSSVPPFFDQEDGGSSGHFRLSDIILPPFNHSRVVLAQGPLDAFHWSLAPPNLSTDIHRFFYAHFNWHSVEIFDNPNEILGTRMPFYSLTWPRPVKFMYQDCIRKHEEDLEDNDLLHEWRDTLWYNLAQAIRPSKHLRSEVGHWVGVWNEKVSVYPLLGDSRYYCGNTVLIVTDKISWKMNKNCYRIGLKDASAWRDDESRPPSTRSLIWSGITEFLDADGKKTEEGLFTAALEGVVSVILHDITALVVLIQEELGHLSEALSSKDDRLALIAGNPEEVLFNINQTLLTAHQSIHEILTVHSVHINRQPGSKLLFRRGKFARLDMGEIEGSSALSSQCRLLLKMIEETQKQESELSAKIQGAWAILESQKAIGQATAVTRLTEFAFFFIPLSFSSSLFGMEFKELGDHLSIQVWVYTALGILAVSYSIRIVLISNIWQRALLHISRSLRKQRQLAEGERAGVSDFLKWAVASHPTLPFLLGYALICGVILSVLWTREGIPRSTRIAATVVTLRYPFFDAPLAFQYALAINRWHDKGLDSHCVFIFSLYVLNLLAAVIAIPILWTVTHLVTQSKIVWTVFLSLPAVSLPFMYFFYWVGPYKLPHDVVTFMWPWPEVRDNMAGIRSLEDWWRQQDNQ